MRRCFAEDLMIKIISGAQTGVDRAALDVALDLNLSHGGWCPKGRLAEDGIIDAKYQLQETRSSNYNERTIANIRDSDGTLIIIAYPANKISGGTLLTLDEVQKQNKLWLLVNLLDAPEQKKTINWIQANAINVLNVAGPRESQCPGIYEKAFSYLRISLQALSR